MDFNFLFFGDDISDISHSLRDIQKRNPSSIVLEAFLEQVYGALREEIGRLPLAQRTSVPVFNGIFELAEKCLQNRAPIHAIQKAITCVCQLASFIRYGFCVYSQKALLMLAIVSAKVTPICLRASKFPSLELAMGCSLLPQ